MDTTHYESYDPAYVELTNLIDSDEITGSNPVIKDKLIEIKDLFVKRDNYAEDMSCQTSDLLKKLRHDTFTHPWNDLYQSGKTDYLIDPTMISGPLSAKFLQFMVHTLKAKRILEIGMFTGYTALAMAESLPPDGILHTCEILEYMNGFSRPYFDQSPHGKKINVHIAPAEDTLNKLGDSGEQFDVIFIDAGKPDYRGYFDQIIDKNLLAPEGVILADNAYREGEAYTFPQTREDNPIHDFNTYLLNKTDFEQVLLPIRDGILAVRRKN